MKDDQLRQLFNDNQNCFGKMYSKEDPLCNQDCTLRSDCLSFLNSEKKELNETEKVSPVPEGNLTSFTHIWARRKLKTKRRINNGFMEFYPGSLREAIAKCINSGEYTRKELLEFLSLNFPGKNTYQALYEFVFQVELPTGSTSIARNKKIGLTKEKKLYFI